MRVGLNGLFLRKPMTGSGQYTQHLWRNLLSLDTADEFVLFCDGATLGFADATSNESARTYIPPRRIPSLTENLDKLVWEQLALPLAGQETRVDLLHSPYFAGPVAFGRKLVITIHDLIPLLLPEYSGSALVRLYTKLVSLAARRADAIIADSFCSKGDIVLRLRIHPSKIHVIYLAPDESCRPLEDGESLRQVRAKYGLHEDFVFYIGGLDVRKNVLRLIEAFGRAQPGFHSACQLAIAGKAGSSDLTMFPNLQSAARRNGLESRVVFLGLVPDEDKILLYNAAKAFAFPSIYEGFGLTPLEAMACGAPVISSRASSLGEVVGDAAITVDPLDVGGLAGAMVKVINDPSLRRDLRQKGLRRSSLFSWRRCAEETLSVYRSVVTGQ